MATIEDAVARFSQGVQRLQSGDYQGAVDAFGAAIAAFPQFEPAFRLRAEVYRALGRHPEANADLEAVISITRARFQEAEKTLSSQRRQPEAAGAQRDTTKSRIGGSMARKVGILQSPIILWTGGFTVVTILAPVVVLMLGAK